MQRFFHMRLETLKTHNFNLKSIQILKPCYSRNKKTCAIHEEIIIQWEIDLKYNTICMQNLTKFFYIQFHISCRKVNTTRKVLKTFEELMKIVVPFLRRLKKPKITQDCWCTMEEVWSRIYHMCCKVLI